MRKYLHGLAPDIVVALSGAFKVGGEYVSEDSQSLLKLALNAWADDDHIFMNGEYNPTWSPVNFSVRHLSHRGFFLPLEFTLLGLDGNNGLILSDNIFNPPCSLTAIERKAGEDIDPQVLDISVPNLIETSERIAVYAGEVFKNYEGWTRSDDGIWAPPISDPEPTA